MSRINLILTIALILLCAILPAPAHSARLCNALACIAFEPRASGDTQVRFTSQGRGEALCYANVDGWRRVFTLAGDKPALFTLRQPYHYSQVSWRCDTPTPTPCPAWRTAHCR